MRVYLPFRPADKNLAMKSIQEADQDGRIRINQVKGILACLVIVRHVDGFLELIPWLMITLSAFCSYSFFLLGFLSNKPKKFADHMRYCLTRFYRPLLLFFSISSILFFLVYRQSTITGSLIHYFEGLLIQSADAFKNASGFSLFWFVPAYVLLTSLRALAASNKYIFRTILLLALGFHFGIANYLSTVSTVFPFSFHVVLYCYPVCLIFERFKAPLISNRYVLYAGFVAFVFSCLYIAATNSELYFSSSVFPGYDDIWGILVHDVCALSSIPAFSLLYSTFRSSFIAEIGKHSFEFYLVHQFVNYLILHILGDVRGYWSTLHIAGVIVLTMLSIILLKKAKIYRHIFSRQA